MTAVYKINRQDKAVPRVSGEGAGVTSHKSDLESPSLGFPYSLKARIQPKEEASSNASRCAN